MCGFFIFFLILVHPIYISTSEIVIVDNIAKVKIKIFRDDLEDGLRLFHKKSISIDNKIKLKKASDRIDSYIKNKFQLMIDNSKINLSNFKYNLENDVVEVSCVININDSINEINLFNNILFEIYKIQKNVVFIRTENQNKSYIFSFSDREKTFNY